MLCFALGSPTAGTEPQGSWGAPGDLRGLQGNLGGLQGTSRAPGTPGDLGRATALTFGCGKGKLLP